MSTRAKDPEFFVKGKANLSDATLVSVTRSDVSHALPSVKAESRITF